MAHFGLELPKQVCAAPVIVGKRVVNVVYLQSDHPDCFSELCLDAITTVTRAASQAYLRLISDKKAAT